MSFFFIIIIYDLKNLVLYSCIVVLFFVFLVKFSFLDFICCLYDIKSHLIDFISYNRAIFALFINIMFFFIFICAILIVFPTIFHCSTNKKLFVKSSISHCNMTGFVLFFPVICLKNEDFYLVLYFILINANFNIFYYKYKLYFILY